MFSRYIFCNPILTLSYYTVPDKKFMEALMKDMFKSLREKCKHWYWSLVTKDVFVTPFVDHGCFCKLHISGKVFLGLPSFWAVFWFKPLFKQVSCAQQGIWALLCRVSLFGRLIEATPFEHVDFSSRFIRVGISIWMAPMLAKTCKPPLWCARASYSVWQLLRLSPLYSFKCGRE